MLYEEARFDAGLDRVPAAMDPCTHLGWFRNHLVWHLALMHLGRGDLARAAELSRATFERAPSAVAGDLHDSISLLWRLDLAGERVGDRWAPFAAIAADRLGRTGLPFHVVHVAMALAGARDWATGERQLAALGERVPRDRTGLLRDLVIPLITGLRAFAAGDYPAAVATLEHLRPRIIGLGGSRAQRDVFHDTLLEACFRAGDAERAARFVAERVARRPEEPWLTRQRALARG